MGIKSLDEEGRPTPSDSVVRRVLTTCRQVHGGAKLANYTVNRGLTELRLRPTGAATTREGLEAFAATLRSALPLGRVGLHVNMLDGTHEASVTVPSRSDEAAAARMLAQQRPLARALKLTLRLCMVSLLGSFVYANFFLA